MSQPYSGKTAVVTGGLGFLGSALVKQLHGSGARVRVLDSLAPEGSGSPRNLAGFGSSIEVVVDDIRNRDAVLRAVRGADVIFHLAGVGTPGSPGVDWVTDLDVSCLGTLHVLEAMRVLAPQSRLVFVSSTHVYGLAVTVPVPEASPLTPTSLFGAHKATGEHYLSVYRQRYGLDLVCARVTDVFGPGQRLDSAPKGTLLYVIDAFARGELLPHLDGTALYDVLFVDDAANIIQQLGILPAAARGTFNVASGLGVSAADVAKVFGAEVPVLESGGRGFIADVTAIRAIGISASSTTLAGALAKTAAWFGHDVL